MAALPASARCVVIGAGIVGNSLAYHLAELGWTDIVQLDKGPLPNPGGSTGHASNFIFPVDHSREFADITLDSVRQYKELGVFTESGGYEVARTEERMEELRRRMSSAKAWGIPAELVTPEQVAEKVPFLDKDVIIGAAWFPTVGVVDSLRAGTIMRERAVEKGALTTVPNVEVTGMVVEGGRIRAVETNQGTIEAETVVIACGVWSPKIARMAGAHIPLTPAVHQMISVGPCEVLAERPGEISFPIVRDMDTFCYERQHGSDMEVGSYAHRAILWDPEDIPSIEQSKLSPTELPFTEDDFDPQLEQALELMPELLGDERAEIRYAINGLLSLTPDGYPILGETPEVKGLWSAAAVWIKEGPGTARAVAEWMTHGNPEIDLGHSDIARFHPHQKTRAHVKARTSESFIKTYGIVHPGEQYTSNRDVRLAPMHASQQELGAVFFETAGWERPHWYTSNAGLVEKFGPGADDAARARVGRPLVEPDHQRRAPPDARGRRPRRPLGLRDLRRRRAAGRSRPCSGSSSRRPTSASGGSSTPRCSTRRGGFRSDLTVMRLAHDRFRVVTGGAHGMADKKWFADRMPEDGGAVVVDLTSAGRRSASGARRPARSSRRSPTPTSRTPGSRSAPAARSRSARSHVLASRISYVGEYGWELYVPMEAGAALWQQAARGRHAARHGAGRHRRLRHDRAGSRRATGPTAYELDTERTLMETGMSRAKWKDQDFIGKDGRARPRPARRPRTVLCSLTVDDHTSASGVKRYMLGGEPILTRDGGTLTDGHGRHPYVTTAGSAPSLGKHVLMAFLPPEQAVVGTELAVSYMEELYPVTVAAADATPLFDPENARIRGLA